MESVQLRSVRPADQDFLAAVYADTRIEEMGLTGWSPDQIQQFLAMQAEAQRRDYTRRFPAATHEIILVDGVPAGRLWVHRGAEEIRLLDVAILEDFRNRGVGTYLIQGLQGDARLAGRPLRHSVVKENAAALRLYERLGFVITGEIPTHHLMEWRDPLTQLTT